MIFIVLVTHNTVTEDLVLPGSDTMLLCVCFHFEGTTIF